MDRSSQGIIISLLAHAIIVWILLHGKFDPTSHQNETTEIILIEKDQKPQPRQQFVTAPDDKQTPKDLIEKLKKQADYLSKFDQRVKKEVIARNKDTTRNAQAQQNQRGDREGIAGMQERGDGNEGFLAPGSGHAKPTPNIVIGESSIAEHIPGIEEGAFTALNTDQFTYYAFFARMNEQVRNRWVSGIRSYMDRLGHDQLVQLSRGNRHTVIEIILTPTGEFARSVLHVSSGDKTLDQTTVQAFRQAAPFPNPPSEMVEADGFIHLKYGFMVRFRPPLAGG